MDEKSLKPRIRFKGFTEAWEQRKCSDISNRYDNLRVPVSEAKRIPGSTPYYGANGIQDYVEGYTHDGEFVLVAEDGANDLKNYPVQYVNGRIWVNNHAHVLQSNKENSTLFLKYLINSADIESVLVGGGRAKLNANVLMDLEFKVPKKLEQDKISMVLQEMDTIITLHQRKYEKLTQIKKSLLEKMFPADGEKTPKIRFKGYTEAWEQRKLGDCCNIFAGGTPSTSINEYWENGTINWLPSGNIQDCDIDEMDIKTKITQRGLDNSSAKLIKKNTALLAMTGATCGKSGYLKCVSSANQSVMAFETDELNSKFLYYTFQRNKNLILKHQAGGAQAGINKDTCQNLEFMFPKRIEMDVIADLISKIDIIITLHQRKCEKLKNIKKSLLEKMFV